MDDTTRFSTNFLDISLDDVPHLSGLGSGQGTSPEAVQLTAEESQASGAGGGTETSVDASGESQVGFGDSFVQPVDQDEGGAPPPGGSEPAPYSLLQPVHPENDRFSDHFADPDEQEQSGEIQLETADSMSSLGQMSRDSVEGSPTHVAQDDVSPGGGAAVKSSDTWETFEPEVEETALETKEQTVVPVTIETQQPRAADTAPETTPTMVETTANGVTEQQPEPPANPAGKWEKFEEPPAAKAIQKKLSITRDDHGAVCAADAMVGGTEWMALDDSARVEYLDEPEDSQNLSFRKAQSMRATSNRKVQIVDALKRTRRLSASSLERAPLSQGQFSNEDDLTRKFTIERDWQVFVKVDKRVPGTKTKWLPVNISVKEGVLVIKRSAPPSMPALSSSTTVPIEAPPLHEIHLQHNHTLTPSIPRSYDKKTKVHQFKLRQTQMHERRTFKRWFFVEHFSTARTIVKIGCPDLDVVKNLSDQINEAIRQLPVTRQQGGAYKMNEVFVDVKDSSDILMNSDGAVLERKSLNRIFVQTFLTGNPECRLILNDIEAILLQGKGQMTSSMSRQVKLSDVVLHPCVNQETYKASREIKFEPVDGFSFELIRCSIEPYVSPPINVSAMMDFDEQRNTVRITASFTVRKKLNLRQRPVRDMIVKFPIPSSWGPLFLAERTFGGKTAVRSTAALRGSFRRKIKTSACQIEVHLGSARYEPEQGAVMWRIGHYQRSEVPHTFRCDLQLKPGMHKPDISQEYAEVTYSLPGNSTGLQVRAFKVDLHSPERWVKYEILYRYRVQMFPDLSID